MCIRDRIISYKNDLSKIGKQVCVISFRRDYLLLYPDLKPSNYEVLESIDMLRYVENGIDIHLSKTSEFSHAVDTLKDLKLVSKYIK